MRYLLILAAVMLPITADAQGRSRGHRSATTPRAAATAPHPNAASAVLPAGSQRMLIPPRLFMPARLIPIPSQRLLFPSQRFHSPSQRFGKRSHRSSWPRWQDRDGHRKHWFDQGSAPFFGGGYYGTPYFSDYPPYDAGRAAPSELDAERAEMRTTGILRLDITPATDLQYYIDGMFMGSSSQLGTEFAVNAGARRIEVRAPGFKPMIFDARFEPGGTVTRRGALEPLQDASTLPRATGSRTMYVIPGCFIGNSRPERDALPKGCDIRRLVTRGGL
jgi:hypothetical protein